MGWAKGFESGSRAMGDILDSYFKSQERVDLAEIDKAKPEESKGFTADQGAELARADASGQYDIGIKTNDDGSFEAYTVTPKADPTQTGTIAMQGVTDFMGNRTTGSMDPAKLQSAKERAMAGVIMKRDPVLGARMMRDVTQSERDDQRFGREQRDWAIKDKQYAEEEDYKTGLQNEFGNSIFAQQMKDYAPKVQDYIKSKAAYDERIKAGEPPEAIGLPPVEPQKPAYSMAQSLADNGRLLAFRASKGKADPAEMLKYAETFKKVSEEGYGQALKLAQSGAPIAKVAETFNQSGSVKFDPKAVVSDEVVKGQDGVPSRIIKFKDQNGNVQTINTLSELDSIGQAESYFNRFFKTEDNRRGNEQLVLAQSADNRGDRALNLQAASTNASVAHTQAQTGILQQTLAEKKELGDARTTLATAIESGDEKAVAAARSKMMAYMMSGKSGMKDMSPEERKANFYLASGAAKTLTEAAKMAHEKVQTSAKDDYMTLMKPNSTGMVMRPEDMEPIMSAMHGADWKQKLGSKPDGASTQPKTAAEATSQAQAALAKGADKALVNERLKKLGYPPIP